MSGVSHESHSRDKVLESHSRTDAKQEYSGNVSRKTGGISDVDILTKTWIKVLLTVANNDIKVKEENDTDNDKRGINEGLTKEADEVTLTLSESAFSATSQIVKDIPVVKAFTRGDEDSYDSDYPTLVSTPAEPNMAEQNPFNPERLAMPNQGITTSSTSGIVSYETLKLGIRCDNCETIFANQIDFENHAIKGKCQWVCKSCKKPFVYTNTRAGHKSYSYALFQQKVEQHKKECDRTCKLCGYSSEERSRLVKHMKTRHSNSKRYACDVCFITFKSETSLYTHKIEKHSCGAEIYRCPRCPKEYTMLQSLSAHLNCSHFGPKRDKVACSVCGKMLDIYTIKRHENSHNIKDLKCDKCPATFNHIGGLRQHQRRHDKDYSHYCETCGKGCYTITDLENHQRIHSGEKPFSCSLCQYRCNNKANLDKHIKIHRKRSSHD